MVTCVAGGSVSAASKVLAEELRIYVENWKETLRTFWLAAKAGAALPPKLSYTRAKIIPSATQAANIGNLNGWNGSRSILDTFRWNRTCRLKTLVPRRTAKNPVPSQQNFLFRTDIVRNRSDGCPYNMSVATSPANQQCVEKFFWVDDFNTLSILLNFVISDLYNRRKI